jgi:hypothetical protein
MASFEYGNVKYTKRFRAAKSSYLPKLRLHRAFVEVIFLFSHLSLSPSLSLFSFF